jgi:hypothetical protein
VRSVLVSACWGVARRLLVMRRSWVRFPQAAPAFVQVRATLRVLRADPSPPAWDGDRPRARARARQRRTPRFAYFIGVSPQLVFTTPTCGPVPEPDDLTRTPGSIRFPVCPDLIAKPRITGGYGQPAGAQWPLMKWPPLWRRPGWPGQASRGRRRQRAASVRSAHGYLVCSLRGFHPGRPGEELHGKDKGGPGRGMA